MTVSEEVKLLGLTPSLLTALRKALDRVLGEPAAQLLQEAGFAAGADVYEAFRTWLAQKTRLVDPKDLDAELLEEMLSGFFEDAGWGSVSLERIGSALAIASPNWAEAEPEGHLPIASCNVSTGLLAAMFGKLAGGTVAVMEVECRSRGDESCRFLVGSNETLNAVFNAITQGQGYQEVLAPSH